MAFANPTLLAFYLYATPVLEYAKLIIVETEAIVGYTEATDATADFFSLSSAGALTSLTGEPGYLAEQDNHPVPGVPDFVYFDSAADIKSSGYLGLITCTITPADDGSCPLTCAGPFGNGDIQSLNVGNRWALGLNPLFGTTAFTPLVVDAGTS